VLLLSSGNSVANQLTGHNSGGWGVLGNTDTRVEEAAADSSGVTVHREKKECDVVVLRNRVAKLEYIEQMLRELLQLSKDVDGAMLDYLLEMATIEASEILKSRRQEIKLHSG